MKQEKEKIYLISANQIEVENCKSTNKPDGDKAIDYQDNR